MEIPNPAPWIDPADQLSGSLALLILFGRPANPAPVIAIASTSGNRKPRQRQKKSLTAHDSGI
jgi:hypothetical protein